LAQVSGCTAGAAAGSCWHEWPQLGSAGLLGDSILLDPVDVSSGSSDTDA